MKPSDFTEKRLQKLTKQSQEESDPGLFTQIYSRSPFGLMDKASQNVYPQAEQYAPWEAMEEKHTAPGKLKNLITGNWDKLPGGENYSSQEKSNSKVINKLKEFRKAINEAGGYEQPEHAWFGPGGPGDKWKDHPEFEDNQVSPFHQFLNQMGSQNKTGSESTQTQKGEYKMKASDFTEKRVQKLVKQSQEGILQEGVDAAGEAVDQGTEELEGLGQQIVDAVKNNPEETLGAAAGAAGGGALGGLASDENRLMKTILGMMAGGTTGGVAGAAAGDQLGQGLFGGGGDEGWSTGEKIGAGAAGAGGAVGIEELIRRSMKNRGGMDVSGAGSGALGGMGSPKLTSQTPSGAEAAEKAARQQGKKMAVKRSQTDFAPAYPGPAKAGQRNAAPMIDDTGELAAALKRLGK